MKHLISPVTATRPRPRTATISPATTAAVIIAVILTIHAIINTLTA